MIRSTLGTLLLQDLRLLFSLRVPRVTCGVISNGLRLARGLRQKSLTIAALEHAVGGMFLRHTRGPWSSSGNGNGNGNGIRLPLVDILSLAEDIDTEEEAEQFVPESGSGKPGP